MEQTIFRITRQDDERFAVEMTKPKGRTRVIRDFVSEAEANAWIIQTRRLVDAAQARPFAAAKRP